MLNYRSTRECDLIQLEETACMISPGVGLAGYEF